jgi:PTS system mannose-specific IID component
MDKVGERLGRFDLFKVFVKLLFLQGLLNKRGMQNIGLAGAMSTAGRKLTRTEDSAWLVKHLGFFNCNPNFVPLIVGGVLKLEEEQMEGKPVTDNDIDYFKRSLASPLAAMADMLFLGNLKPLALTLACIFAIYRFPIGLLAIFLLYNLLVISCRLWGIYFGYAKGWELVDFFSGPGFQRLLGVIQGLGAGIGGVLVGIVFYRLPQGGQWMLPLGGAVTALTLLALRRNVPASWLVIILFPATVLIALLFI